MQGPFLGLSLQVPLDTYSEKGECTKKAVQNWLKQMKCIFDGFSAVMCKKEGLNPRPLQIVTGGKVGENCFHVGQVLRNEPVRV